MRSGPNPSPLRTMKNETDTITVILALLLEALEAAAVLIVALVALLLTVARWRPSQAPAVAAPTASTESSTASVVATESSTASVVAVDDLPALLPVAAISDAPPAAAPGRLQAPLLHPLAVMALELEALPVTRLRPMANTRSKRARKHELVAALVAC